MLAQFIAHHRDELVNFGMLYERGCRGEVEIVERTSWSCPHVLGRWSRDCGCDGQVVGTRTRRDFKFRHGLLWGSVENLK